MPLVVYVNVAGHFPACIVATLHTSLFHRVLRTSHAFSSILRGREQEERAYAQALRGGRKGVSRVSFHSRVPHAYGLFHTSRASFAARLHNVIYVSSGY